MQNPNSSKEVWLVTNGLSKNQLKKELLKKKPREQISQLLYILNLNSGQFITSRSSIENIL